MTLMTFSIVTELKPVESLQKQSQYKTLRDTQCINASSLIHQLVKTAFPDPKTYNANTTPLGIEDIIFYYIRKRHFWILPKFKTFK